MLSCAYRSRSHLARLIIQFDPSYSLLTYLSTLICGEESKNPRPHRLRSFVPLKTVNAGKCTGAVEHSLMTDVYASPKRVISPRHCEQKRKYRNLALPQCLALAMPRLTPRIQGQRLWRSWSAHHQVRSDSDSAAGQAKGEIGYWCRKCSATGAEGEGVRHVTFR